MASYDFSALQFSADEVRGFNEVIVKQVLESPDLAMMHTFYTNIRNQQEIGYAEGSLGLVGIAATQGCGARTPDNKVLGSDVKLWSPARWEIFQQMCWTDLEDNFGRFLRNLGSDVDDLSTTEYFAFLEPFIMKAMKDFFFRTVWFGDTAAALTTDSPAGVFAAGTDLRYWNLIDGLFVQLAEIATVTPARNNAIAANAELTFALQDDDFTNQDAYDALIATIDAADMVLTARQDKVIYCTYSVWRRVMRWLQENQIFFRYEKITNGMELVRFDGIEIYAVPMWDALIRTYQHDGIRWNNPHRIVYTAKGNLPVGLEGNQLFTYMKVWHNEDTEITSIKIKDALDTKIIHDNLVQYGA